MPLDVPDATLPELAIHATLAPTDDDDHFTAMFDGSIDRRLHPDLPPTGPGEFATHVAADGHATVTDGPNVRLGGRRGPPVGSDPTLAVILSFDITDALMRGSNAAVKMVL